MAKYLLDTHVLLWAAVDDERLSPSARALIEDRGNSLHFSVASIWEVVLKSSQNRDDFRIDPSEFRTQLLNHGYIELAISSHHVLTLKKLPPHHKDPFDRILVAQSIYEGLVLLTNDKVLA